MRTLLSPVDAAVFTGPLADYLVAAMKLGLEPSADGWWDDGVAYLSEWGFDLTAIRTPVLLLHGRQDRFVPFSHGQWLAAHIPGCEARLRLPMKNSMRTRTSIRRRSTTTGAYSDITITNGR